MRKMPVISLLCRAVLALYPKEFRREFAAEILASFTRHYQEERRVKGRRRVLPAALRDLLDLLCGAFAERLAFSACKARKDERMEDGMGDYRVVFRLYFAWQAKEEADWLRAMSRTGWELVHTNWCFYYFRRMEDPQEYEYKLERRVGLRWLLDVQEAYLSQRKREGWEFFNYFKGWYYFRRPVGAVRTPTAEVETEMAVEALDYTRRYLRRGALGAFFGLFGFLAGLWLRSYLPCLGRLAPPLGQMLYGLAGFLVGISGVTFIISFLTLLLTLAERRRLRDG